jgi:hypothetical protein
VLTVARDHRPGFGGMTHRVDALLTKVPARAWQCVSAGAGAKSHRLYHWALCAWTTTARNPPAKRARTG